MKQAKRVSGSRSSVVPTSNHGQSPPHAEDFEQVILGSIILEAESQQVKTVLSKAKPYHFYNESHQRVYSALTGLLKQGIPIDILTVTEQLRKNGDLDSVGGPFFISQLTGRVASSANIEYWFRVVYQKFLQREIIRIGSVSYTHLTLPTNREV